MDKKVAIVTGASRGIGAATADRTDAEARQQNCIQRAHGHSGINVRNFLAYRMTVIPLPA